jgi:hypothetical protein
MQMKNRALYCCIAVSALAGCSTLGVPMGGRDGDSPSNPCKKSKCDVDVVVVSCTDIRADPPKIYIEARNKAKIHWYLKTPGYTFAAKGIEWKDAKGHGEFETPEPGATEFRWKDKNTTPGEYDYNIHLIGPGGGNCDYHPTVVNG